MSPYFPTVLLGIVSENPLTIYFLIFFSVVLLRIPPFFIAYVVLLIFLCTDPFRDCIRNSYKNFPQKYRRKIKKNTQKIIAKFHWTFQNSIYRNAPTNIFRNPLEIFSKKHLKKFLQTMFKDFSSMHLSRKLSRVVSGNP